MSTPAPPSDPGEEGLELGAPASGAAGVRAVVTSLGMGVAQMGVSRTVRTLWRVNQAGGFDCPGCAWPETEERSHAEFCENGVKAVAEEATQRHLDRAFFAEHPLALLAQRSDYWLGQQGRLCEPMYLDEGATHYRPITWEDAFGIIAQGLQALASPDEAIFYTSGRTSNEAAFLYQLFVRRFGTNNLPDCSNMCHESSGVALGTTIGIGKGTVTLADFDHTDLVLVVGQNPGTNHPRMLTTLERARDRGATIIGINPLREAGLGRFRNPQRVRGLVGRGTDLATHHLPIRVNADLALFQLVNRHLLEADAAGEAVLDRAFLSGSVTGEAELRAHLGAVDPEALLAATGLEAEQVDLLVDAVKGARSMIVCWAMGLTQHRNSVATIREIVNLCLLTGNIGRPGAGLCPVRGHSNVQGDRTMGIVEKPFGAFLDALGAEFGFAPPRHHGYDTVDAIRAMAEGRVGVFTALGGNFVRAAPDSAVTEAAMARCRLTVQVSTKLNRSHVVTGTRALILPALGRTELDVQAGGAQVVSVEDSMGMVHSSRGRLAPASSRLRSEVAIVAGLARATLGADDPTDWEGLAGDYRRIRAHISAVIPGFEAFEERIARPGGFALPNLPRDERRFATPDSRAHLSVNPWEAVAVPAGRLLLQTIRSHDQFNTTIYGLDDRYRGVRGGRRVVFVHPEDLRDLSVAEGALVDLVSEHSSGERRAPGFRVVGYPIARGCAAAYFPETNVLVPLDATAAESNTPASKSVVVRLEASRPS